jgi:hypothetical protein
MHNGYSKMRGSPMTRLAFMKCQFQTKTQHGQFVLISSVALGCGRLIQDFTRTTDGGATWIPGKMGNDKTIEFSNISAIDENEAWVAMNKRFTEVEDCIIQLMVEVPGKNLILPRSLMRTPFPTLSTSRIRIMV